ncbi:ABC-2 type transport system permease protein [Novosphingobium kunmingense]|uniref:ABC-2 type transport system permease protein n=1 Tax=Novosphingobium kunmingense TaxID=1211806 RepID=A0A2N0I322_9SPHN|nr:ABC transporter permease [Novosphingobium kunmingense]PKB25587.1 ABC-2 type transport system permease protein [Novosphingobium kunmingense]
MIARDPFARRRAAAIRAKEWAQVWLDPSTFGLVVLMPLILMILFGNAVSLDVRHSRLGVVDRDHSQASRELVGILRNNESFAVVEGPSLGALERGLVDGTLRGVAVIPEGFGESLLREQTQDLQLITDGAQVNTATFLTGHLRDAVRAWVAARAGEGGVAAPAVLEVVARYTYNPGLQSRFMLVPGAIGIVMAMIGSLLTALIMAREYERGTMEGLLSTPIAIPSLVLSKLLPYYVLGLASTGICVAVAVLGYGLPFRGSLLALFLIASAFLAAVLGQGLLISAGTKNQFVSTQFALLSGFLPSLLLSGFLFEIDSMPRAIQWLTYIVPARYLIPPLQSVFLVGDVWSLFLPNIVVLLGFGAFFFLRVTRAIKRTIA